MCACLCACVRACVYMYVRVCRPIRVCMGVRAGILACVHMYMCMRVYVRACVCGACVVRVCNLSQHQYAQLGSRTVC